MDMQKWAAARVRAIDAELAVLQILETQFKEHINAAGDTIGPPLMGNRGREVRAARYESLMSDLPKFQTWRAALEAERQTLQE